jgi:hypothetical protein
MVPGRRIALSLLVPLIVLASFASGVQVGLAQGPGGFKPAGNYKNTSMLGSFFFNAADGSQSIFVFANRQIVVTVPPAPASTASDETSLFLNVSTPNLFCSINDNSADFNVTSGAASASLHVTITPATPGCSGVASDMTIDITWSGAGPIQLTTTSSRFNCSGYTDETQGTDADNAGVAIFNMTGLAAPITAPDPQVFHFGSSGEHAQGAVPPDSCRGGVGGKGAGRPTPAAGNYATTLREASVLFFSSDFTTFLFMSVDASTNTANPLVGPSTSTAQTSLDLSFSSPGGSVGGCFLIGAPDFSISGASAALHTSLTSSTPTCGGTNSISGTFPIDAAWTGTSPVATTMTDSQYACLGYRFQTNTAQTVDTVADVNISMPGLNSNLIGAGGLGSIDTRTHADGTPVAGCFFRG